MKDLPLCKDPPQAPDARPFAERTSTLMRDVAVDAVYELVRTRGWARTRMSDVAKLVGVSKPTLYKHLGSKEQLAALLVEHEVDSILAVAKKAWDGHPDNPLQALHDGLEIIFTSLRQNLIIGGMLSDDEGSEGLLPIVLKNRAALLDNAVARFKSMLDERLPHYCERDRAAFADTLVRLIITQAILPSDSQDEALDTMMRIAFRLLGPGAATSTAS